MAISSSGPRLVVSDDPFAYIASTLRSSRFRVFLAVALTLIVAEISCSPTKSEFRTAYVQRTLFIRRSRKFTALSLCFAVGQTTVTAVLGPVATVSRLSTTGAVRARFLCTTSVLISASKVRVQAAILDDMSSEIVISTEMLLHIKLSSTPLISKGVEQDRLALEVVVKNCGTSAENEERKDES